MNHMAAWRGFQIYSDTIGDDGRNVKHPLFVVGNISISNFHVFYQLGCSDTLRKLWPILPATTLVALLCSMNILLVCIWHHLCYFKEGRDIRAFVIAKNV